MCCITIIAPAHIGYLHRQVALVSKQAEAVEGIAYPVPLVVDHLDPVCIYRSFYPGKHGVRRRVELVIGMWVYVQVIGIALKMQGHTAGFISRYGSRWWRAERPGRRRRVRYTVIAVTLQVPQGS